MSDMKVEETKVANMNPIAGSKRKSDIETAKVFDENKTYTFAVPITWVKNGEITSVKTVTGEDLNWAVRTIYAEAGGLKNGTQDERKAMADLLTNRIGADRISGGIAKTYRKVIEAPKQFECFYNETTRKPSPKFEKAADPKKNLKGDEVKEWNLAYDSVATEIKEFGGSGPKYSYTENRKAKIKSKKTGNFFIPKGWDIIGASRFRTNQLMSRPTK